MNYISKISHVHNLQKIRLMHLEGSSNTALWNVDIYLPLYKVQCPISHGFQNYKTFEKREHRMTSNRIPPDISQVSRNGNFFLIFSISPYLWTSVKTCPHFMHPQAPSCRKRLVFMNTGNTCCNARKIVYWDANYFSRNTSKYEPALRTEMQNITFLYLNNIYCLV